LATRTARACLRRLRRLYCHAAPVVDCRAIWRL
jgi:hypothetical protein